MAYERIGDPDAPPVLLIQGLGAQFVREPKQEVYGMVAVFEDLYGNLWDLLELNDDHPVSKRAVSRRS
jgi:hypothetical protein